MKRIIAASIIFLLATIAVCCDTPDRAMWTRQIGTNEWDFSDGAAVDASGNVYVSGSTKGDLGATNAGRADAFLRKFDSDGNVLWTKQIGTSENDGFQSVAVDASGNVYATGWTRGDLGAANAGGVDVFLSKFDSDGNVLWMKQIGSSHDQEGGESVAVDASGNVYIAGTTGGDLGAPSAGRFDAFLGKFDSEGNLLWVKQMGTTENDAYHSVAVDASGDIYAGGSTEGDLGAPNAGIDALLSKYDSDGEVLWTKQIGTSGNEYFSSVVVDASGNVYVGGTTEGDLGAPIAGGLDAFLSKFDSDGNVLWMKQTGTSEDEGGHSVDVDASGNIYASGWTDGDLAGASAGDTDAFLSKFDSDGNVLWTKQVGTKSIDKANGVAADALGNVYISGESRGDLDGPSAGGTDAFLMKFKASD